MDAVIFNMNSCWIATKSKGMKHKHCGVNILTSNNDSISSENCYLKHLLTNKRQYEKMKNNLMANHCIKGLIHFIYEILRIQIVLFIYFLDWRSRQNKYNHPLWLPACVSYSVIYMSMFPLYIYLHCLHWSSHNKVWLEAIIALKGHSDSTLEDKAS